MTSPLAPSLPQQGAASGCGCATMVRQWSGLVVAGLVAGVAAVLAALADHRGVVVGASPLALALGLVLAQPRPLPVVLAPGLQVASRTLLRLAIVAMGARVGAADLAAVGVGGLVGVPLLVVATLAAGRWLAHRLGLSAELGWLLAAGHAVCGAAAVAAVDGVLRCRRQDVTVAVAAVTVFGSLAMLAWPAVGAAVGAAPADYGFWVGATVHEVAQVVAAARWYDDGAVATANLVKLLRVGCLVPLGLWLAIAARDAGGRRPRLPWFVLCFVLVAGLQLVGALPAAVGVALAATGDLLLAVAMAALGLQTSWREVQVAGWRPLAAAGAMTLFVSLAGLGVAAAVR